MSKDVTTAPLRSELLVKRRKSLISRIILNREIYLMALPGLILLVIFRYLPMYGITVAFKDFNVIKGIIGSPWIGLRTMSA